MSSFRSQKMTLIYPLYADSTWYISERVKVQGTAVWGSGKSQSYTYCSNSMYSDGLLSACCIVCVIHTVHSISQVELTRSRWLRAEYMAEEKHSSCFSYLLLLLSVTLCAASFYSDLMLLYQTGLHSCSYCPKWYLLLKSAVTSAPQQNAFHLSGSGICLWPLCCPQAIACLTISL